MWLWSDHSQFYTTQSRCGTQTPSNNQVDAREPIMRAIAIAVVIVVTGRISVHKVGYFGSEQGKGGNPEDDAKDVQGQDGPVIICSDNEISGPHK